MNIHTFALGFVIASSLLGWQAQGNRRQTIQTTAVITHVQPARVDLRADSESNDATACNGLQSLRMGYKMRLIFRIILERRQHSE